MPAFATNSPLRYPGGKAVLSEFLAATIEANGIDSCTYLEPFAGGAGAAINLLLSGSVSRIVLNDADRSVWSFWRAILDHTEDFVRLIQNTPVTVTEWQRQRAVYQAQDEDVVALGFAAFYLNRCNRSGILTNGSVIGGLDQTGKWKIGARYYKQSLIERIERIAAFGSKIEVDQLDAIDFLRRRVLSAKARSNFFVYLDPPYFAKGARLYLNYYDSGDHAKLATFLRRLRNVRWLVTYDNVPEIRALYAWCSLTGFRLHYSAAESREGSELMISSDGLELPLEHLAVAG